MKYGTGWHWQQYDHNHAALVPLSTAYECPSIPWHHRDGSFPFADFDDESKCCRTSMTREKAVERFTATFGRAPQEHELPERLQIGRQR